MMYALLLTLIWAAGAQAGTLTIGPGQSIREAIARLQAGDTLVLGSGTYAEGNLRPPSGVTIKATPGATVLLQPNNQAVDTIFDLQGGVHDVTFEGLLLDGSKKVAFPIYSDGATARITFRNGALKNGRHSAGLLSGTAWTLANNQIVGNGVTCCSTHEDDHGLYFSADHSQIVGNVFEGNACYNLQVYSSTGHNPTDNVIEGNLFRGSKCGVTLSQGANQVFRNNIIVDDATQFRETGLLVFAHALVEGNTFVRSQVLVDKAGIGSQVRNNRFCEARLIGASGQGNTQGCGELPALDRAPGGGSLSSSVTASSGPPSTGTPAAQTPPSREAQMAALQAEMDAFQQRVWDEQRAEETAYQQAMTRVSQGEVATMGARLQQVFSEAVTRQQALLMQQQEGWFALLRRWQAVGR